MASLSSYDVGKRSFEGRRYRLDIQAAQEGIALFMRPIKKARSYRPALHLFLGNHEDRITRAIDNDPKLEGVLSLKDLGYEKWGWTVHPFLKPYTINGVVYAHYFPSGQMGRPCTSARAILQKYHMSCVAGHQQGRDIAYGKRANGKPITAIIAGSFYQHNESYLNPITNSVWRGIYMLHEVKNGSYDEMPVSLNYLRKKFDK
jgi:hypothetical protein